LALTKVSSDMVSPDPTNASNLSSGDVPLAQLGNAPATDTTTLEDDIALLGFKVAVAGTMAKYNLVDQTEDAFMDATGIDASESVNETRSGSNYYTGTTAGPTGGTIDTYTDGGTDYRSHTFLDDGVFTVIAGTISADYFIIAGGAGGGNASSNNGAWGGGGGGGAGGFLTATGTSLISQAYTITVGDGSAGAAYQIGHNPVNGENSSIVPVSGTSYIAIGGGAGASALAASVGGNGGSGGGGSYGTRASGTGTVGPPRQGYDGGNNSYTNTGASGGGAGAVGGDAAATVGPGGIGVYNNYRDGTSGTTVGTHYFGGGGGGGAYLGTAATASYGGGAGGIKGGTNNGTSNGSAATANSGGGGGGGSNGVGGGNTTGGAGGDGGKGIVIIRYEDTGYGASDMTLVSNATTAETTATKGDVVMTYTNGAGTATLNTDLTAEFSADNGSNWTSMTLVDQGTTGTHSPVTGHKIVSAHNVTAGVSGTAMRYRIKTFNQSGSKETRIQAVSLGWS
jgi:hypothetical protein